MDRRKFAAIFDEEPVETIAAYAAGMSDLELRTELIDRTDYALATNNSGAFAVAAILIAELEARGKASPEIVAFGRHIETAIARAHSRKKR